ncbi:MAG: radical SAM protein [Anaerolineales bacterium]|nr:radical SAM protein [Anaerolineales bacterium]
MITVIDRAVLPTVRNPGLRAGAARYLQIYENFMRQVRATGIGVAPSEAEVSDQLAALRAQGATFRNDGKSLVSNFLSPACAACRQGHDSFTFFVSLKCHRSCFYCFNPNQEGFDHYTEALRDLPAELDELKRSGRPVRYLALTGGEPLLHPAEALAFFSQASQLFPDAHLRLYTTGDHLTPALVAALRDAGLDEIRFSIRMHDLADGHRHTFDRLALAKGIISTVMVEMPILPGTLSTMQAVLLDLDRLGVDGINLLELCYPRQHAQAFNQRDFAVRSQPYRVLYDYWYAGGLPIAGSESDCLALVAFARRQGLRLGVHYCSLENKHTGQIYQQNVGQKLPPTYVWSERDFFWKTIKAYAPDVHRVRRALRGQPLELRRAGDEDGVLELHPSQVAVLRAAGVEVELGLSSNVWEARPDGQYLRELRLDLVRPASFTLTDL